MSHQYQLVQWTPYKRRYDVALAACVIVYFAAFFVVSRVTWRGVGAVSDEILLIRAAGTAAFICLHVTLSRRLRDLAPGLTPRSVLEKLGAMQMLDVHLPTTDGREVILTRYTQPGKRPAGVLVEHD